MTGQLDFDGRDDGVPSGGRDVQRERAFLEQAARGDHEFVEHVEGRLAAGDELYSNSFLWVGVRKLLDELREEALDLAAWATLAEEALDGEHNLNPAERERVRNVLAASARYGAQAYVVLSLARRSIGEHS